MLKILINITGRLCLYIPLLSFLFTDFSRQPLMFFPCFYFKITPTSPPGMVYERLSHGLLLQTPRTALGLRCTELYKSDIHSTVRLESYKADQTKTSRIILNDKYRRLVKTYSLAVVSVIKVIQMQLLL